jgi:2-oxo-4-hydroxy-4-carboxy-5-ureidoimidazoline decarboxylase
MERWERINAALPEDARAQLQVCCGSSRWINRMLARVPFASREAALQAARDEWFALDFTDWREAFDHHPRIGAHTSSVAQDFSPAASLATVLSASEQARVAAAADDVKRALAAGNRAYEERFGHIYIVCATGKSGEEMLAILNARLENDPETEIRVAAEEHAKICDLRLTAAVPSPDNGP